jgi:hypothetical protein
VVVADEEEHNVDSGTQPFHFGTQRTRRAVDFLTVHDDNLVAVALGTHFTAHDGPPDRVGAPGRGIGDR